MKGFYWARIPVIEQVATGLYGLGAGVDQWASGTRQLFTNEQMPTTVTQYANSEIAGSLNGIGKYAYTGANVIGNMAPSILLSYVTAGLGAPAAVAQGTGAAAVGMSAAGNAYGSALRDGYSIGQARAYSTLVGAAEATLQYILGGIASLGGITDDLIKAKINMIDNSLLRIAAKLGVDVFSEVTEEELQNFLEPAFRSIIFGEKYDAPTVDEMVETAIVTAGTTLLLGGGDTVSNDLRENGQLNATVQTANNQANAAVNQEAVAKSLRSKGISYKKADGIAEVIVARLNGQELTRTQRERLSSALGNPTVQSVISKLIKKKADGIDSVQNSMYDEGNISGINDGEEAARWELLNQRTDVFGDNDATVTEGSTLHKAQNAYSEGNHGGGGNALKFNNWDDMKSAYKGTITQFIKENKPKYSPEIRKWFNNGGLIEIQDIDGKQIWTYTSSAGISVPYIDGYIKFPDEYLNPTIKSVDIGEFTGDRGSDIDKMLSILQADYGINEIPDGYTVHHDIVNGILQLVDENIHTEFTHIGGYSIYR